MAVKNFVLNTNEAYTVDVSGVSDVLTTGLYVKDAPEIIKGHDSAVHDAPVIITTAATVRALHAVYAVSISETGPRFAIWKVYQQVEASPEVFYGYLIITITSGSTIASIDSTNTLGAATIAKALFAQMIQTWLESDDAPQYDDSADISTDVTAAGAKVRFTA